MRSSFAGGGKALSDRREPLVEFLGGREPVLPRFFERLQNHGAQFRGDLSLGVRLRERDGRLEEMRLQELRGRVASERARSGQQLVEHEAHGVEIAAAVESLTGRQRAVLLRGRILQLSQEDARRGHLDGSVHGLGDAEIDHLHERPSLVVPRQHQVVGRNVAVHDVAAMEVAQRQQRLVRNLQGEADGGGTLEHQQLAEVDAVDELHDEVGRPVLVEREIVDRADVRVFEPGCGLGLFDETELQFLVDGDLRPHDLDDADLVQEAVANLVDRSHPALAHLAEDLVFPLDECAGLLWQGRA